MSLRSQQHSTILAIQQEIDRYSHLWVTTNSILAYAQYTYLINELVQVKLAIHEHERVYGWNN